VAVTFGRVMIDNVDVFYREAGPKDAPTILLLHGYPTSSHMFRDLISRLSDRFHLVAPDLPGFGQTKAPPRGQFGYTFDNFAKVIDGFVRAKALNRYAVYIFDYGAPTGIRLAVNAPERISAIITQNGNAYAEGLGPMWALFQNYWNDPTLANRDACRATLTPDVTKSQYTIGSDESLLAPDGYELDIHYLARPGQDEIQLDLIYDYLTNVAAYPKWQEYFRSAKPPILAVWGKNDPFFLPQGAEAFRRDQPAAEISFVDAGHFALETRGEEIAQRIRVFMEALPAHPTDFRSTAL
jgi:pimeloyl-ACP methyl ester carboxylesterase